MRNPTLQLSFLIFLLTACQSDREATTALTPADLPASEGGLTVKGDFDGDGQEEELYEVIYDVDSLISLPEWDEGIWDPYNPRNCASRLNSKSNISDLTISEARWGYQVLLNEGDLDGDGGDELSLLMDWPTSVWHAYRLYSYKNGAWMHVYDTTVNTREVKQYNSVFQAGPKPGLVRCQFYGWDEDYVELMTTENILNMKIGKLVEQKAEMESESSL